MITYEGGTGETREDAVIILGAANSQEGIKAEYDFLFQKLGVPGQDWDMVRQALLQHDGRYFDEIIVLIRHDRSQRSYFFDITDFFG